MAIKPMNIETASGEARAASTAKGDILDRLLADKQEWAPLMLRLPLGVIFFAHGAQKVLGGFGGFGWNGTMRFFTQTLHIPGPLLVAPFLVGSLGGLACVAGAYTRCVAFLSPAPVAV